jgi:ribose transport system substrate-binding protein
MKTRRLLSALAVVAAVAPGLTGCGSDDSASSSEEAVSSNQIQTCVDTATAAIDKARQALTLQGPPGPLDISSLKGKSIWEIQVLSNPLADAIAAGFKDAAAAAGVKATVFDGKGTVSLYNQGLQTAVGQRASGIAIFGIPPETVTSALQAAADAGVPVVDAFNSDANTPLATGLYSHVSIDSANSGKLVADWVLADSKCDANVAAITAPALSITKEIYAGAEAEFKKTCPWCKISATEGDVSTAATSLGPLVQTTRLPRWRCAQT